MTGTTSPISGLHQVDPVNKADLAKLKRRERVFTMSRGFSLFEQLYSLSSVSEFFFLSLWLF